MGVTSGSARDVPNRSVRQSPRWIGRTATSSDGGRGDVGFLAGLTVAPDRRGRGLGAALTAAMTRALLSRHDTVALGVYSVNVAAIRLYRRLGFTGALARSSVQLA
ncbi:GNAT family N-acetyltransferase [Micromonospora sp. C31]|uniref:GNAT family N-acetyltransferase n=1 Tax=Micromonospora sp. C31 TaxID=2824876 RepID=UPI001B384704|nr:GNAT family N-acetyltransferase [Micromonospora sp. C31]MBQ1073899.1 GNAT family N-acetyltransferase [Micromonospora sp. C31]